ncbi:TspO/MBR family protein [Francisella sp. XLW-1]|uniref:TspO/MBR family protein n=1 Tax=Francisella sp. XLW-1 TaxID=2610887 RepID=UPI00123E3D71|nr:TspO/MBR family protein [Francisella sp. XLW-1]
MTCNIKGKDYISLTFFIIVILGTGMCVGALISTNIPTWFVKLEHPFFAPPNWLFAPVWTVLYIMIVVSGWIVFKQKALREKNFIIYAIQLGLNFLWSFIFFCWHNIDLALIEMSILWVLIAWNLKVFLDINKIAGYLLIPYLLWVGFAWILNLNYAMLN